MMPAGRPDPRKGDLVIAGDTIHEHEYKVLVEKGSALIFNRRCISKRSGRDIIVLYDPITASTIIIYFAEVSLSSSDVTGTFVVSPKFSDAIFYGISGVPDVAEW